MVRPKRLDASKQTAGSEDSKKPFDKKEALIEVENRRSMGKAGKEPEAEPMTKSSKGKRKKRKLSPGEQLPWKSIDLAEHDLAAFEDSFIYSLEELDGSSYQLISMEGGGKTIRPTKKPEKNLTETGKVDSAEAAATEEDLGRSDATISKAKEKTITAKVPNKEKRREEKTKKNVRQARDGEKGLKKEPRSGSVSEEPEAVDMKRLHEWTKFDLHPQILRALQRLEFHQPTPIQRVCLPIALQDNKDILGAAETGSGKTLAFGLPILNRLLTEAERRDAEDQGQKDLDTGVQALCIVPTRELAIQVQAHLSRIVEGSPWKISVAAMVGGMSQQKQERLLSYKPQVVVATPGRLWELISDKHEHFAHLSRTLRFLVLDEADRMVEPGHFRELQKIFDVLKQDSEEEEEEDEEEEEEEEQEEGGEALARKRTRRPRRVQRQTFLFSATLMIGQEGRQNKKKRKKNNTTGVLQTLMSKVGVRGKPVIINMGRGKDGEGLSAVSEPKSLKRVEKEDSQKKTLRLPSGLTLCDFECVKEEKIVYLYYFLLQHPGRTIVFANSIHQVRKLVETLSLLQLPIYGLHAQMQQRQRLKKLDRFKTNDKAILIATDVAARGLDIPAVSYVVHYNIARSTDVFVHRSGRTARARAEGLSLSLVEPGEKKLHLKISQVLEEEADFEPFMVDERILKHVRTRVRAADVVQKYADKVSKRNATKKWFVEAAEAADMMLDESLEDMWKGDDQVDAHQSLEASRAKAKLEELLAAPLRPAGTKRSFVDIKAAKKDLDEQGQLRQIPAQKKVKRKWTSKFKKSNQ